MAPQKRKDSKDVSDRTIKDKPSKKPVTYGKRRLLHFDYFDSAAASDENAAKAQAQTPTVRARAANDGDTKRPSGLSSLLQFKSRKSSETRIGVQTATLKDPDLKVETMTADPLQADVDTVCAFTGTHAALAKRYLKVKDNNVEAAVNAILENEDIDKLETNAASQADHSWNEGHFHGDRDGTGMNLQSIGTSSAPTRGPSPAPGFGLSQPTNRDDEDAELQNALRASRETAGMPPEQETGVLMHDGTEIRQFGPATREHYEQNSWALVPTGKNATMDSDEVPDLEPADRVHVAGEPRTLKHLPDGDYIPSLITICHAIPAVREAFLMRDNLRPDYGSNAEWWRGQPISLPKIVNVADGSLAEPEIDDNDELLAETQRLMAFLDASDRSYGSIGGLTQTNIIKNTDLSSVPHMNSATLMEYFLQKWTAAAVAKKGNAGDIPPANLFTTTVGTNASEGMDTPYLTLIDMPVSRTDGQKTDLFELLDGLLWDTDPDETETADNFIEQPAEVLVMRLHSTTVAREQLGVVVPATFHIDKYLKENVAATKDVRDQMAQAKRRVNKISEVEEKLKNWPHPKNKTKLEAKVLLAHSLGHFSGQNRRDADKLDTTNAPSFTADDAPAHYSGIVTKLETVIASIDEKLVLLAAEKEKSRKAIAELSKSSAAFGEQSTRGRYTLRGVVTKPNITYVLRRKDQGPPSAPTLDRMDTSTDSQPIVQVVERPSEDHDDEDTTPRDHQWWRIDYEVSSAVALQTPPRITITQAPDYDVIRAVELEFTSALLVYASDAATASHAAEAGLPVPLQQFVDRDNEFFKAELERDRGVSRNDTNRHAQAPPPAYDGPRQSIEGIDRLGWSERDRGRRRDSMDSTHVILEDDDDIDYRDEHAVIDADMTEREALLGESPPSRDGAFSPEMHHGYGLGYDLSGTGKQAGAGYSTADIEPEVAEIKLSPPPTGLGDGHSKQESQADVEMVERKGG